MLWTNKKFAQSVTFTEDAADIALLEAIEKELSVAKYQTFSNLCKQALWQFLSVTESTPTTTTSEASSHLQQQLAQLQSQLGELEQNILTEEQNRSTRIEARLNRLAQQVAQVQANLDLQVLQRDVSPPPTPAPQPTSSPALATTQPQHKQPDEEPVDPILSRLSSLIDDF
ncbi:MAG: hypothetical protein WBA13_15455 [Microcoleaceae cyanobacterium]